MRSYKPLFARFLAADPERLHFAAHSHHLWPDVSFEAQLACWDDAARLADRKWDRIFGEVYPEAQRHVARHLGLPDPATVVFGPNTHGFLMRLLSCLPAGRPAAVLSTDGEFHSFDRQMRRLVEAGLVDLTTVPVEPFASFAERFAAAAARGGHDLVFVSQVFFETGFAVAGLAALVDAVPDPETQVVIDGYHGFLARPTDLGPVADRAFYLAGGYKYAMAGEGVAFMHVPAGHALRPRDTGWLAGFGHLAGGRGGAVGYPGDGGRFLGATFDPVGLYRLNAVCRMLEGEGLGAREIHARALALQRQLVEGLGSDVPAGLRAERLAVPIDQPGRGNFLTFRSDDAADLQAALKAQGVVADHRARSLRIGFGLYHDPEDVARLCRVLAALVR